MNDEIKEILSLLNSSSWSNEAKQIEDYITNLQQENERLKTIKPCMLNFQECYVVKDYKTRCEKAVEFIKDKLKYKDKTIYENDANWLLNILQKGSEMMIDKVSEKEIVSQIEKVNEMLEIISNELSWYDKIDDFTIELDEMIYTNGIDKKQRKKYKILVTCTRSLQNESEKDV